MSSKALPGNLAELQKTQYMQQLNITYLVSTLGRTGPTNQLLNLISRLDKSKLSTRIVTISNEPPDSRVLEFKALGVPVCSLNLSRINAILLGPRRLRGLLKIHPADVVHSQGIRADFLNSTLKFPTARIATQRNDPFHDYPMLFGQVIGSTMAQAHSAILRRIPKVVACSYSIEASNRLRRITSITIQNGIDAQKGYIVSSGEKDKKRKKLNLPQDEILFVSAAPLIDRKNPIELIRAFGEAHGKKRRHLVLLGNGPLLQAAKRLASQCSNISLKGNVTDVDEYLEVADCFVSASLSEGLPNSVIEALAWGLPIILSDIPAHREIQQIEKRSGDLFPVQNRRALTKLIQDFRPSDSAARAARSIVVDHLNADVMTNNYRILYESLASASLSMFSDE